MHHWLLFKKYTSIKRLVYLHLWKCLSVYTKDEKIIGIKKGKVPLYQGTDSKKILYISGVAWQISASDRSKVTSLMREIAADLAKTGNGMFTVKIVPASGIHIELADTILAAWLHSLTTDASLENNDYINTVKTIPYGYWEQENKHKLLFTAQYSHARCCSLIRLGKRDGLIQLRESTKHQNHHKSFISLQPLPWLDSDQKIRIQQADEVRLVHQLVKMVDDLVFADVKDSVNWETAILKLSAAFENFCCYCRIWGDVKINSLELAQTRLGLLIATQQVFRSVLETKLGVVAAWEL